MSENGELIVQDKGWSKTCTGTCVAALLMPISQFVLVLLFFFYQINIHCSETCENVAIKEYGWIPPSDSGRPACPPELNVASFLGGQIDDRATREPEAHHEFKAS